MISISRVRGRVRVTAALLFAVALLDSCGVGRRTRAPQAHPVAHPPGAVAELHVPVPLPAHRTAFQEGDQAIEEILLHYDPDLGADLYPVYRDLAQALHAETRLTIAVAEERHIAGASLLFTAAGFRASRLHFVECDGPVSVWARDRMIPFRSPNGAPELFQPTRDRVDAEVAGDMELAHRLASRMGGDVISGFYLEGGNVVVGGGRVFVGCTALHENPDFEGDAGELLAHVTELFECRPVLLGDTAGVPHPHLDMFLTYVGGDRVLLGDPGAGAAVVRQLRHAGIPTALDKADAEVILADQLALVPVYETIRAQLVAAGLRVDRLPILHTSSHAVYTWNNAVLERRADGRRAYVPVYGVPHLDDQAQAVYRRLGFRVYPIDVSRIMQRGGTVRCLTNVLRWKRI